MLTSQLTASKQCWFTSTERNRIISRKPESTSYHFNPKGYHLKQRRNIVRLRYQTLILTNVNSIGEEKRRALRCATLRCEKGERENKQWKSLH